MKSSLISILLLVALHFSLTANSAQLLHEPDDCARVIADQINTADLFVIEKTGGWARVVNTKTGLVGWAKMPKSTSNDVEKSAAGEKESENDANIADEENNSREEMDEDDISGMVLAVGLLSN